MGSTVVGTLIGSLTNENYTQYYMANQFSPLFFHYQQ